MRKLGVKYDQLSNLDPGTIFRFVNTPGDPDLYCVLRHPEEKDKDQIPIRRVGFVSPNQGEDHYIHCDWPTDKRKTDATITGGNPYASVEVLILEDVES